LPHARTPRHQQVVAPGMAGALSTAPPASSGARRPFRGPSVAARTIDAPSAWCRLGLSLLLATIGGVGMGAVVVALPAVQAEFGGRAAAPRCRVPCPCSAAAWGGACDVFRRVFPPARQPERAWGWGAPQPNEVWMGQGARHVTMEEWGGLSPRQYLVHDRDSKCCAALPQILAAAGGARVGLPPRSPTLNAAAERGLRAVTAEALSRMMRCGAASLRHGLHASSGHDHQERHHQGQGPGRLWPQPRLKGRPAGPMPDRARLGGLRQDYARKAAYVLGADAVRRVCWHNAPGGEGQCPDPMAGHDSPCARLGGSTDFWPGVLTNAQHRRRRTRSQLSGPPGRQGWAGTGPRRQYGAGREGQRRAQESIAGKRPCPVIVSRCTLRLPPIPRC
jgi:hypothetical protein